MDDRSSPDPSEVEASEEFPILYGLLTAADTDNSLKRKQGTNSNFTSNTTARYFQGSRRRRMRRPSSETVMEPDSSTTDDLEPLISPLVPVPSTQNNNSSPLLVLRLTATATSKQFPNPPKRQEYQILPGGPIRGVRKASRSKRQIENEEPSSTTSEDGEIPLKIRRISTENLHSERSNNVSNTNGGTLRALLSKDRGSYGQGHTNYTNSSLSITGGTGADFESFGEACNQPTSRRLQRIGIDFFPCNNCDLNFTKLQHLELHQSYHTNKKLYKCSQCSAAFYLKKSLLNHESKHHGLKSKNIVGNLLFDPSRLVFRKSEEGSNEEGNCDFNSNYNNSFQPFQLPIDLEITKVPDTKNQLLSKLLDMKTSESVYEVSNKSNNHHKDNIIELLIPKQSSSSSIVGIGNNKNNSIGTCSSKNYPCGHCTEEFDSLSSLLKHTARNHVPKNGIGDTFHIEIETRD